MLLQSLVALYGSLGAEGLEQLHDDNQQDNCHIHNQVLVTIVAVVDGNFTQTAAADDAGHCGVAQDGGDCGGPNPGGRCGVGCGRGGIIGRRGGNGIGW